MRRVLACVTLLAVASCAGYTRPRDATVDVLQELSPAVETPAELAQAFATALLAGDSGCEVASTAEVVSVTEGDPATAVVETTFGCDDSVGGARYTLTMEPDDVLGWVVQSATIEDRCLRAGAGEDLCV
jgi:hypothetical protein